MKPSAWDQNSTGNEPMLLGLQGLKASNKRTGEGHLAFGRSCTSRRGKSGLGGACILAKTPSGSVSGTCHGPQEGAHAARRRRRHHAAVSCWHISSNSRPAQLGTLNMLLWICNCLTATTQHTSGVGRVPAR